MFEKWLEWFTTNVKEGECLRNPRGSLQAPKDRFIRMLRSAFDSGVETGKSLSEAVAQ